MKYLKFFESYLTVEEVMSQLRTVTQRIVQNLPTFPRKQGADLMLKDNCRIVVRRISASENIITFMEVEVYFEDKFIGSINIDFKSEAPHILVAYNIKSVNEEIDYLQSNKKILVKN
jgi:hypothetical protein